MARNRKKKSNVVTVNMKGVETRVTPDADQYLATVEEVTQEEGPKANYFKWKFRVIEGQDTGDEFKDAALYTNTSLSENALFNLKGLLEALGEEVPDDDMELDLESFADKELGLVVENETFEGRRRAVVVDFFVADEFESSSSKKSNKKKDEKEDDDEKDDKKDRRRSRDKDDDKDDKRDGKKGGKGKEPAKLERKEVEESTQDELETIIEDNELKVDLSDFRTLRKMVAAVIDALEKEDLLEDDEDSEDEDDKKDEKGKDDKRSRRRR